MSLIVILSASLLVLTKAFPSTRSQGLKSLIQNLVDNDFIIATPKTYRSPSLLEDHAELSRVPNQIEEMGIQDDVNFETPVLINDKQVGLRFRWPGGIIPVEISDQFSADEHHQIVKAMDHFTAYTCIRFIARDPKQHLHYLRIEATIEDACSSQFGHVTGRQMIYLNRIGCFSGLSELGVILHELMHTVGFLHEQSRSDRDSHVVIAWQNIKPGYKSQFVMKDGLKTLGPYDIDSVMHYGIFAFTKNGYPTIMPQDWALLNRIGQRKGLSFGDIAKINTLYKCYLSAEDRRAFFYKEVQAINSYQCIIRPNLCMQN